MKNQYEQNMQDLSNIRQVPISWACRVRTGNQQAFEYVKDFEVSCRLTRLYLEKTFTKKLKKQNGPFRG